MLIYRPHNVISTRVHRDLTCNVESHGNPDGVSYSFSLKKCLQDEKMSVFNGIDVGSTDSVDP